MMETRHGRPLTRWELLQEEEDLRRAKLRMKIAAREEQARRDLEEEKRALAEDPDAITTHSGRRITGRSNQVNSASASAAFQRRADSDAAMLLFSGMTVSAVQKIVEGLHRVSLAVTAPAASAGGTSNSARHPFERVAYQDDQYLYHTARVCPQAQIILEQESQQIREFEQMVSQSTCAKDYAEKKGKLESMASQFQMRRHPVTQEYVHSFERVVFEESRLNPMDFKTGQQAYAKTGIVLIFTPLSLAYGDSRGIKVKLGDQYDQKPVEAVKSGDHEARVQARPVAPPNFHYIG
jgi:hypothetical protein